MSKQVASMRCPKCGHTESFEFGCYGTMLITMSEDGADEQQAPTDLDWDSDSSVTCPKCHFDGTQSDFEYLTKAMQTEAYKLLAPLVKGNNEVCFEIVSKAIRHMTPDDLHDLKLGLQPRDPKFVPSTNCRYCGTFPLLGNEQCRNTDCPFGPVNRPDL